MNKKTRDPKKFFAQNHVKFGVALILTMSAIIALQRYGTIQQDNFLREKGLITEYYLPEM